MTDLTRQQQLAESAQQLLDNEAFNIAFTTLTNQLADQWANSPPEAEKMREHLYAKIRYGQEFYQNFKGFISKFAAAEALENQETE